MKVGISSAPEQLDPPVVGNITHISIELAWDGAEPKGSSPERSFRINSGNGDKSDTRYTVQEEELGGLVTKGFGTVYSGFARRHEFEGLKPRTTYRYRIRAANPFGEGLWSKAVEVTTLKQPPSNEDLQKAVKNNNISKVSAIITELNRNVIDAPDKFGNSALMIAAQKGLLEVATVLLDNGSDVNYQNSAGKSALMIACYTGRLPMVRLLRKNGARWGYVDNSGATPMHWAVDGANTELIQWMIEDGCEVDVRDSVSGWTPLMRLASTSGIPRVARQLIEHGASVNSLDRERKSVLIIAALNGHAKLVEMLVASGANLEARTSHRKSALDFARSFEHEPVVKVLEGEIERRKTEQNDQHNSSVLIPSGLKLDRCRELAEMI